eukprot:456841-Alexandrium_andersonii.AAC.1
MSASLVGSEIVYKRQRLWSRSAIYALQPSGVCHPGGECEQGFGRLRPGCLLYTSDAADDM